MSARPSPSKSNLVRTTAVGIIEPCQSDCAEAINIEEISAEQNPVVLLKNDVSDSTVCAESLSERLVYRTVGIKSGITAM